jgi:acyl-CoA thioesterase YciA
MKTNQEIRETTPIQGNESGIYSEQIYSTEDVEAIQNLTRQDEREKIQSEEYLHILSCVCKTMNIGVNSNLFGGTMMSWLDEAGFIYAKKITGRSRMVTKSFEKIDFKVPVKVDSVIDISGKILEKRSKGITVELVAKCRDTIVCSTSAVYIHIDENGKAIAL